MINGYGRSPAFNHLPGKAFLETILQTNIALKNYKAGPQKGSLFCLPDPLIFHGRLLPNFGGFFCAKSTSSPPRHDVH